MRAELENADLAWAFVWVNADRFQYPRLSYICGAFKGDEYRLDRWDWCPDQDAFYQISGTNTKVRWRIGWHLAQDAVFNPVPWAISDSFQTARKKVLKVIGGIVLCKFCPDGSNYLGPQKGINWSNYSFPSELWVREKSEVGRMRTVDSLRKCVDQVIADFETTPPIKFGVCSSCKSQLKDRSFINLHHADFSYEKFKLQNRITRKIWDRYGMHKVGMRLAKRAEAALSRPIREGYLEAKKIWEDSDKEDMRRRHVKKRPKDYNFFSMVNAVGQLTNITK
jgi:hypothetical protein